MELNFEGTTGELKVQEEPGQEPKVYNSQFYIKHAPLSEEEVIIP